MPRTLNFMKLFTAIVVMASVNYLNAQVGIGTTNPNASSSLEIYSTNSGVLIPRVALTSSTDNTTISNPAEYLMVFNTATTSTLTPGLVYWKDNSWKRLANTSELSSGSGSGSGWALNGNNISGSEFLGTLNDKQLLLKAKNRQVAVFGIPADSIATNTQPNVTGFNSVSLGYNTLVNGDNSFALGTQSTITSSAYKSILLGSNSTANHAYSIILGNNVTTNSDYAVAIGEHSYVSGDRSLALGYKASAQLWDDIAIGSEATVTKKGSIALGTSTNVTGEKSVAIGYEATTSQNNAIILGKAVSDVKIGIGTNTPTEKVEIQGSLKLVDGTQGNGKILVSDANGKASWADASTLGTGGGSGSGWALNGNNISGSEFLGTTNWSQLNFKVNNTAIGQFHPNGGVGIGRGANINGSQHSFAIGENADASGNQDAYAFGTNANATTNKSMALGYSAYTGQTDAYSFGSSANASGNQSMALGYSAATSQTDAYAFGTGSSASGSKSMALGNYAQATHTSSLSVGTSAKASGFRSFAFGYETLSNNNDTYAIGYSTEATGQNAMAFGYDAAASGQNAVAIGYQSVANNPNTIILGNTSSDSWYRTKVGIGTTNPSANLEVSGSAAVTGTFKYVDGTQGSGKVLVSDANGNASWASASSLGGGSSSSATYGEIYSTSSSAQSIIWDNSAQPFNFGSSTYTSNVTAANGTSLQPSVTATYRVSYNVTLQKGGGNSIDVEIYLAKGWNESDRIPGSSTYVSLDSNTNIRTVNINKFVQINAYQQIYVFYKKVGGNTDQFYLLPQGSSFNIERIN